MSVTILDHCPSCGKCSRPGVCPTDAIKVEGSKTFIGEGCIDCGLCIPVCPIGVIRVTDGPAVAPIVENEEWANAEEEIVGPSPTGEEATHEETSTGP